MNIKSFLLFCLLISIFSSVLAQSSSKSNADCKETITYCENSNENFITVSGYIFSGDDNFNLTIDSNPLMNTVVEIADEKNRVISRIITDNSGYFGQKIPKCLISTSQIILTTEILGSKCSFMARANASSNWKIIFFKEFYLETVDVVDDKSILEIDKTTFSEQTIDRKLGCCILKTEVSPLTITDRKNNGVNEMWRMSSGVVWMGR